MPDGPARSSWPPVVCYAAVSAANQMLWLTYTPVTTDAARHYGVSEGAVGWLAELFPFLYVLLAVPAGRLIDRRLRTWLAVGALLTAAGGLLRLAGDAYLSVLAGQVLVAVAQPLILNAVTAVSSSYLATRHRAGGIAVSSAGIFAGMVLALGLGALLGVHRLTALLAVQGTLAAAAAVALCLTLRAPAQLAVPAGPAVPVRAVLADRPLRLLIGLVCLGFGVFIALTTWLQALLDPAGVSSGTAGALLFGMVLAGVVGSALVPPRLARHGMQLHFVLVSVLAGAVALVVLAVWPGADTGAVAAVALGVLLLTDLPIVLELVERRAGPAGGTATGLVWLAGNAAGLLAALVVQLLVHVPAAAFAVLAGLLLLGVPLLRGLQGVPAQGERHARVTASETA